MSKYIYSLLFLSIFIGCGNDTSTSDTTSTQEEKALESYFSIDEKDFSDPSSFKNVIIGQDTNAILNVVNAKDGLYVSSSEFDGTTVKYGVAYMKSYLQKPLFLDDNFIGIVDTVVEVDSNSSQLTLQDATNISQVYDNINLNFTLESIASEMTRSLKNKSIGRYDYLNSQHLKAHVYVKNTSKVRTIKNNELVLHIDIPKDYHMIINPKARGLDCDIFDAKCIAEIETKPNKKFPLEQNLTQYGLTFSTDGSYIEFGLGTQLKLTYDKNLFDDDEVTFDLKQSMFYDANFVYTVKGELSKNWESALNLTDGFDLVIPHPYSAVANVSILIKPDIVIGASGSVKGEFVAKANNKRQGAVEFSFDSKTGKVNASQNITTTAENTAAASMKVDIEAKANAYIFPNFGLSPRVDFLHIQHPFGFGIIRSGIKINNDFEGHFSTGFQVTQDLDKANGSLDANASFLITYQALVDYKFNVKFADKTLYQEDNFTTLYESSKGVIFNWSIDLLNTPKIIITKENAKTYASFDIDAKEHKDKIKLYYNLIGSEITTDNFLSQKLYAGKRIELKANDINIIKVKAVLLNKDIGSGIWNFGSSYSLTATKIVTVEEENTPVNNSDVISESDLWASYPEPEICDKELFEEHTSIFTYFEIEHGNKGDDNYTRCRYDIKRNDYAVLSYEYPTNGFYKTYNSRTHLLSSAQEIKNGAKNGLALSWMHGSDPKDDYVACGIYKDDVLIENCETSITP